VSGDGHAPRSAGLGVRTRPFSLVSQTFGERNLWAHRPYPVGAVGGRHRLPRLLLGVPPLAIRHCGRGTGQSRARPARDYRQVCRSQTLPRRGNYPTQSCSETSSDVVGCEFERVRAGGSGLSPRTTHLARGCRRPLLGNSPDPFQRALTTSSHRWQLPQGRG
jgi:hypothetical protein